MIRLFLIHPPGILSLMWQVAKHIVDAKTQSRILFLPKLEDIFNYLEREVGFTLKYTSYRLPYSQCLRTGVAQDVMIVDMHRFRVRVFDTPCL